MADSYRDIAQSLLDRANLRFQSKGTTYDVVYAEQETIDRPQSVARYPGLTRPHVPAQCVPGARHPRCAYLVLVDAYRTGGDDHHDNWTLLYRGDIQQFAVDGQNPSFAFPDVLANDGATTQFPYFDDSADITWQFDVIFPNGDALVDPAGNLIDDQDGNAILAPTLGYSRPSQGTPHPLESAALFLNEQWQRSGPVLTVTRHYQKIAPATAQQKIGYTIEGEYAGYHLVSWTYDTAKADYTPPDAGSVCPINDPAGVSGHLDFSSYKVIAPPKIEVLDPLHLRITVTYGAIPGPLIAMDAYETGPTGKGTLYMQRRALGDTFASSALKLDSEEVNGFSKVWKWFVPDSVTLSSENYDASTGLRDIITQVLVAAGTHGQDIDSSGRAAEVKPLNEFYSIKETTVYALFAQRPTFIDYETDPETHNLIEVMREIVFVSDGPPSFGIHQEGTQKQLNAIFGLRTTRTLQGTLPSYDVPDHVDFTIPAKLLSPPTGESGDDGETWKINYNLTTAYRKQLKARRHITYVESPPPPGDLLVIQPTTFHYDGVHFSLHLDGVITDAHTHVGASGGSYTELVDIPASIPSLSAFPTTVEQLVGEECTQWRYGYWKLTQIFAYLQ
jgi:hypothetical protein